ncbi:hypothetical protein SD70_30660 [Gordoniibacillus kamchatkensis]|uniref:Uncharacterized protein n=1 Tax=Gordoniibacillus kamchatkensis TaxID=1590651 RepID=A0ABR5A9R4_9BACL|nr:hypothetical protein [Paenibacillus sp. VKM B-2647]KIL37801.1 hypothetical protein SD70_30660 [Paenibacillus sp. VKM B-2647]
MGIVLLRAAAAALLVTGMLGCSAIKGGGGKAQANGGGESKTQSESSMSPLDQELKRQSEIYKELLKHNAQRAQKDREADRKLLEGLRKQEQQARTNQIKELQRKQGLIDEESDSSEGGSSRGGKKQSDQSESGGGGSGQGGGGKGGASGH